MPPPVSGFDNSTLAWVRDEIDLACAQAVDALARHAAAPDDAKPLAAAREHLHQARGALTLVGLAGVSHVAATVENCVARLNEPQADAVAINAAAGAALAALRRYIDALMAGHPDQPLRLYPPYRALLRAAGQPDPAPLDLFFPDLGQRPPRREGDVPPLPPPRAKALRLGFARGLAKWQAGEEARGFTEMRNAVAQVEQSRAAADERAVWWVALAWFDLPRHGTETPRLLAALDRQFAALELGNTPPPDNELLTGLLHDIAGAPPGDTLRESVRTTYRLADLMPPAEDSDNTRRAPCRAPLATAMAEWEAFARGGAIALMRFHDVAQLLLASARDSGDDDLARLVAACVDFAAWLRRQPERADTAVMLEVAGALLLMEDAIAQEGARSPVDAPLFAAEVAAQAARLDALRHGSVMATNIRQHWRDQQLTRRAAEEILVELAAAEQVLEAYFRAPGNAAAPAEAAAHLHAAAGVLLLLDDGAAAHLGRQLEARVAACGAGTAGHTVFAAIADRLAALTHYCRELRHGTPDPALLAAYADDTGVPVAPTTAATTHEWLGALRQALSETGAAATRQARHAAAALANAAARAAGPAAGELAAALEQALARLDATQCVPDENARMLLARAAGALEGMFGALAEARVPADETGLRLALAAVAPAPADDYAATQILPRGALATAHIPPEPAPVPVAAAPATTVDAADTVDPQLAEIFLEEADEHLRLLADSLNAWRAAPRDAEPGQRLARILHTFKGGARMCGARAIGEFAHGMEARIAEALRAPQVGTDALDAFAALLDQLGLQVDSLRPPPPATLAPPPAAPVPVAARPAAAGPTPQAASAEAAAPTRLRADLIDRLIAEAGEMAGARTRIEGGLKATRTALLDLTDNIARLRSQLREFEIIAETGMPSRQGGGTASEFDPLELDRFTRLQELARLMTESANDMALVQHVLTRETEQAGTALAAQARHNRELTHALLGARMVPFDSVADRLRRVVRQTAKELERQAELEIDGGDTPVDRNVLERMLAPLEHLLRNAVAHGIESAAARRAAGKPEQGRITLGIAPGANEIALTLADDGQGLDLDAIRRRAVEHQLVPATTTLDADALAELIFHPGFSTAATVNEIAGRGVGLDVVRNEVDRLGGRIATASRPGAGTRFEIVLPLSLALIPALPVQAAGRRWAIPATLVVEARELDATELAAQRDAGGVTQGGQHYPWHALAALYGLPRPEPRGGWRLLLASGGGRIALEVEAVEQNQEVAVKPVGTMLARVPGLTGATVLADGAVALIVNPLALAERARRGAVPAHSVAPASTIGNSAAPAIMVVDDSLTVRKITGRLLERAGYRVLLAKDGVEALEQLHGDPPAVLLADIEMPRMDGFALVRALRAAPALAALPVIMISSRSADRHRQVALELGVRHYLGKPYDEDELLALIAGLLPAQ